MEFQSREVHVNDHSWFRQVKREGRRQKPIGISSGARHSSLRPLAFLLPTGHEPAADTQYPGRRLQARPAQQAVRRARKVAVGRALHEAGERGLCPFIAFASTHANEPQCIEHQEIVCLLLSNAKVRAIVCTLEPAQRAALPRGKYLARAGEAFLRCLHTAANAKCDYWMCARCCVAERLDCREHKDKRILQHGRNANIVATCSRTSYSRRQSPSSTTRMTKSSLSKQLPMHTHPTTSRSLCTSAWDIVFW